MAAPSVPETQAGQVATYDPATQEWTVTDDPIAKRHALALQIGLGVIAAQEAQALVPTAGTS